MRGYLNKLISVCASCASHQTVAERHTIEYWSKREPYRSTTRAFGHIELINPIETPESSYLAVRGWVFDIHSRMTDLRIIEPLGESGTTVSNLAREDVIVNMPTFKHSRMSGFISLLPARNSVNDIQLRASYQASGEQINIIFERTPVSLGITTPGAIIAASSIDLSAVKSYVAVVVHSNWTPDASSVGHIVREYTTSTVNLAVFSDLPHQELDKASPATAWHRRISGRLADVTGTLLRYRKTLRRIIFVGPETSELLGKYVLPVLAHSPTPPLSWIPSVAQKHVCTNTIQLELPPKVLEL